jgi:hypothetical protein
MHPDGQRKLKGASGLALNGDISRVNGGLELFMLPRPILMTAKMPG